MASRIEGLRDPSSEWIPGAVEFTHWRKVPWTDRAAIGATGLVRIVSSEAAVGFTIQGGDHANWLALVRGPGGTVLAVPGCKVASISFDATCENADFVEVP